jgi:hypothetical protein
MPLRSAASCVSRTNPGNRLVNQRSAQPNQGPIRRHRRPMAHRGSGHQIAVCQHFGGLRTQSSNKWGFRMSKRVADVLVETLQAAGVKRCYGIIGDTLNRIANAIHESKIEWVHMRHEEAGAFAASAEAQFTGELVACAGSCGPGSLHFINGLYEANRNRAPVILIATQVMRLDIGFNSIQEVDFNQVYKDCSEGRGALGAQRGESRRPRGVDQDLARPARSGASGCESESCAAGDATLALYVTGGCDRDGGLHRQSSAGGQGPRCLGNDGGERSLMA